MLLVVDKQLCLVAELVPFLTAGTVPDRAVTMDHSYKLQSIVGRVQGGLWTGDVVFTVEAESDGC